jgi:hypothetical protein
MTFLWLVSGVQTSPWCVCSGAIAPPERFFHLMMERLPTSKVVQIDWRLLMADTSRTTTATTPSIKSSSSNKANGQTAPRKRAVPAKTRAQRRLAKEGTASKATIGAVVVAVAAVAGAGMMAWLRYRDEFDDWRQRDDYSPAAFAATESHPENFDQTRSAGPDAMRDDPGEEWDEIDQALDESFPASDPPARY